MSDGLAEIERMIKEGIRMPDGTVVNADFDWELHMSKIFQKEIEENWPKILAEVLAGRVS